MIDIFLRPATFRIFFLQGPIGAALEAYKLHIEQYLFHKDMVITWRGYSDQHPSTEALMPGVQSFDTGISFK